MRVIPVESGQRVTSRRVVLSGREYRIDLRWSDFEARFYLTLLSAAGAVLVAGAPVVSNQPLLEGWHSTPGVPAGELVALDTRRVAADPGLDELGETVRLTYWEPLTTAAATITVAESEGGGGGWDPL